MRLSGRVRGWLLYAAAWIPIAAIYAQLIGGQKGVGGVQALYAGIDYAIIPALLGVIVWWLTGRITWPARRPAVFFLAQLALATTYSVIWLLLVLGSISLGTGLTRAVAIVTTFAGWQLMSGYWTYGITACIAYAIRVTWSLREKEAARAKAEVARASAELSALRGQLNPHFLFNTLHTVIALVRREPQMAEAALEQFGEMLRYVLDINRAAQEDVALDDELEFVRNFLALEQLRLGDRLRVVEDIHPDTLDCVIPSLTLQPLVENAVKYAVASRVRGGTISISSTLEGSSVVLGVADDGPGVDASVEAGTGVGLRAVKQRLETRFPGASRFELRTAPGEGFSVRLTLPARTGSVSRLMRPKVGAPQHAVAVGGN
ncbi:MAG TPA: histidine kinase [Gemmatimonadaceae bacterium]|nr:histidine kinase [Gemmatimonadaceae bacterium]